MNNIILALFLCGLFAGTGCSALENGTSTAQGSGTGPDGGARGHVKIDLPF